MLALLASASGFVAQAPAARLAVRPARANLVVLRAEQASATAAATLAAAVISFSAGVYEASAAPPTFEVAAAATATSTLVPFKI